MNAYWRHRAAKIKFAKTTTEDSIVVVILVIRVQLVLVTQQPVRMLMNVSKGNRTIS